MRYYALSDVLVEKVLRKSRIMLAAREIFHMLRSAGFMWPMFVVLPALKLLSVFHSQTLPNVWVAIAALQLAALQRGLRFNVGSCGYSGRPWKGSTSFKVRRTAAGLAEYKRRKCFSHWRKQRHTLHKSPNPHQAKPFFVLPCAKSFVELFSKRQLRLSFIPAQLINVFVFYNTISTGLFYLITILHSLILFYSSVALPLWLVSTLPPVTSCYLNHLLVSGLCASLNPDHIIPLGATKQVNRLSFRPCEVSRCRKECSLVIWRHLSGISNRPTVRFLNSASLIWLKSETMFLWMCKISFLCYPCELLYLLQR